RLKALDRVREQQLAEDFAGELRSAFEQHLIEPNSCLVLHTFFSFHLLGLALWLHQTGAHFTGRVILCGMFYPGSPDHNSPHFEIELQRFRRFKLAASLLSSVIAPQRVCWATSCQSYTSMYHVVTQAPVGIHPIITGNLSAVAKKVLTPKQKTQILLYAGSVKEEKGLRFVLQHLQELLKTFAQVDFIVHLNTSSAGIRDFPDAHAYLRQLADECASLDCIFGTLTDSEFQELLNHSDAIVCHYNPQAYLHKTSGLLWDVMARENTALICTQDTWLQEEYSKVGGTAFGFQYENMASLIDAITSWKDCQPPFIYPNDYYRKLMQSFPDWLERQCITLYTD
ncbi:glycosyltransferase, partial [Paraglaciecola sp.]|uniref:glycosyltransferase n=1 Tax=Paraglaciecola sp. TaxID=1920173 RepID=UPI0032977AB9